jgi:hypothetical protein
MTEVSIIPTCLQGGPRDDITCRNFKAVNWNYFSVEVTGIYHILGRQEMFKRTVTLLFAQRREILD